VRAEAETVADRRRAEGETVDVAPATVAIGAPARAGRRQAERILSLLSPLAVIALWEAGSRSGFIDSRFFPAPSAVAAALWSIASSGELAAHLWASASRVVIGFGLGAVPGVALGLLMGMSSLVRAVVRPLVSATFPIPKIAILPLVILVFGLGEASKWAIVAIGVFFLVLINTMAGVLSIPRIYWDVGRTFGAGRLQQYLTIALPGALPSVLTGLQLGLGIAFVVLVAAEFVGAQNGVGYLIWYSWQTFLIEQMYVGLMVIAVFGFATQIFMDWLEARLVPWRGR
jgi:NitT/TauT family transport system permease protein